MVFGIAFPQNGSVQQQTARLVRDGKLMMAETGSDQGEKHRKGPIQSVCACLAGAMAQYSGVGYNSAKISPRPCVSLKSVQRSEIRGDRCQYTVQL